MYGSEEVVLLIVEHVLIDRHARCHQLRDATLDELLRHLGVFQLVADGHAASCTYQFRQIGVERMVRETSHLELLVLAVSTLGKRDAQYLASYDSVGRVCLVEVATTKQHDSIRMLGLKLQELLHHRGHHYIFCHIFLVLNERQRYEKASE